MKSIQRGDSANVFRIEIENHWGTHVDAPEPFLRIQQHPSGIFIAALFQCRPEPPMGLLPIFLGKMFLDIPILVNGTQMVEELLRKSHDSLSHPARIPMPASLQPCQLLIRL